MSHVWWSEWMMVLGACLGYIAGEFLNYLDRKPRERGKL